MLKELVPYNCHNDQHFILPPTLASADEKPQQWFELCKKLQTTSLAPAKKCSQDCFNRSPRCTKYISIEAGKPEPFCSSSRFENIHKSFDANSRVSVCKDNHAFHTFTFHLVLSILYYDHHYMNSMNYVLQVNINSTPCTHLKSYKLLYNQLRNISLFSS